MQDLGGCRSLDVPKQLVKPLLLDRRWFISCRTFKVEKHIGSVILKHLSHKFDVHILNVDFLVSGRLY